jgi:predicted nucleic acid-binding protein
MNVVDSSGWLEYFAGGKNASFFAPPIEQTDELVVPALGLFEVFKRVAAQRDEAAALQTVAVMQQGEVAPLDATLALSAARLSLELGLPPAHSIMLATARACDATFWTQDADFEGLEDVRYRRRR